MLIAAVTLQWSRNSSASLQNHPQQSSQASLDSFADSTLSDPSSVVKANAAKAPASAAEDGFGGSAFRSASTPLSTVRATRCRYSLAALVAITAPSCPDSANVFWN